MPLKIHFSDSHLDFSFLQTLAVLEMNVVSVSSRITHEKMVPRKVQQNVSRLLLDTEEGLTRR